MLFLKQNVKMYNITLNLDPNWAKSLDPDPNSMYLDPQHCFQKDLTGIVVCWPPIFILFLTSGNLIYKKPYEQRTAALIR